MPNWNISARAASLHADALVWDNHACLQHETDDRFMPEVNRWPDSGVDMIVISVGFDVLPWQHTFRVLAVMRDWFFAHSDSFVLVHTADDIVTAKQTGKTAVAFNIEGTVAIQDQISLLRLYYDLGVRWMSMAYNLNNAAGGGCHDNDSGLSDFGRQVVDEMAEVGMVTCCTHTGYETAREVIDYSPNPVIFSHSNARAVTDHPRNIPDDLMKACADKGGVIGINGIGIFIGDQTATIDSMVRHLDYTVQIVGADHVSIALDFSVDDSTLDIDLTKPSDLVPEDFEKYFPPGYGYESGVTIIRPEQLPEITEALLRQNYAETDVRNILGENLLRLARQVWK